MFCLTSFYMSGDRLAGTTRRIETVTIKFDQLNLELLNSLKNQLVILYLF